MYFSFFMFCDLIKKKLFLNKKDMPTILIIAGWRLFFYSNEGDEPVHIHAEKSGMECKFWLNIDEYEIK